MPQVVVNKQKWKEAIEGLESSRRLAKQVLSQLSYTPIEIALLLEDFTFFILRTLCAFCKPRKLRSMPGRQWPSLARRLFEVCIQVRYVWSMYALFFISIVRRRSGTSTFVLPPLKYPYLE